MIIAQSAATSRLFAVRHHERVDEDADLLGLSAANAAAAISGTFVVNGSPTQTSMADRVGARSQLAQLVFAAVALLVLLFLTGPLQYLPRCVLAGIVFTIAVGMIDVAGLRDIRRESRGRDRHRGGSSRNRRRARHLAGDHFVALQARAPQLSTAHNDPRAECDRAQAPVVPGEETESGLIVYGFAADLFYANINRFVDEVRALVKGRRRQSTGSSSKQAR